MDIFYLMHRDNKIAAFTVDNGSILSFKINGDWQGLLPYGVSGLRSFINWLEDRAIPHMHQLNYTSIIRRFLI